MEIIGLSGFARAGKDETAKILVEQYGFKQVAFADKLRDMIYALNPFVVGVVDTQIGSFTVDAYEPPPVYLQQVIDEHGWDGYKETKYGAEIRRLLQRLGTEAGRLTLWDTIWIDAAFKGLSPDAKIVVSDARFFNEFDAIRARGGEVWRIERPGVGPANNHASELEAVSYEFDRTIHNSRDLDYLRNLVGRVYTDFAQIKAARGPVVNPANEDGLRSRPASGNPLGPRKGDGSITSVNVPKRRG